MFKKSILFTLISVLLLPVVIGVFPQKALATPAAGTLKQAEAWVLARGVAECIADEGLAIKGGLDSDRSLTNQDVAQGNWFNTQRGPLDGDDIDVGEWTADLAEGNSADSKASCQKVAAAAIDRLDVSATDVICALGFKRTNPSGACPGGAGDFYLEASADEHNPSKWNEFVRTEWSGYGTPTKAMQYLVYYNDFYQECSTDNGTGWDDEPWDASKHKEDSDSYHLQWKKGNQVVDSFVSSAGNDRNHTVHISGYGLLQSGDKLKCGELANRINSNATAYKDQIKKEIDDGTIDEGDLDDNGLGTGTAGKQDECLNSNPLSWFGCPVLNLINDVLNWLDAQIHKLLFISEGTPADAEKSWAVFRNLAYIILVPMMMLMVIGTAIGIGPFDAYTVKKALPRMLIAVVFIALSFELCRFLINISNVVGNGVGNIITSLAPEGELAIDGIEGAGGMFTVFLGGAGIAGLIGVISWPILGSFGLVMMVGLLVGFFILILRQVLVVMLIVLAPIAILVWIFPGNDKLWGMWKNTFMAMLYLYPIIAILIASGKFFAATAITANVGGNGADGQAVSTLVAMVGYVAPFFLIPATFKFGLGVFGNLAGMVNDRGRGFFDGQRKRRAAMRAEGWQDFKSGSGKGRLRQSALVRGAGERYTGGIRGNIGSNAAAIRAARWDSAAGNAAADYMKSPEFQAQSENDNLLRAAQSGTTRAEASRNMYGTYYARKVASGAITESDARAEVDRYTAQAEKTLGYGRKQQVAAAQQLVSTGTGYDDVGQMSEALAIAAGGSKETGSRLAGFANFAAKTKGRHDLAPGFGALNDLVQTQVDGGTVSTSKVDEAVEAGWNSGSLYQISNGKPAATKQFAAYWKNELKSAAASGDEARLLKSAAAIEEFKAMQPNASGENSNIINELLNDNDVKNIVSASLLSRGSRQTIERDPTDPNKLVYGAGGTSVSDVARKQARAYERPDPNNIQ